jgi:hypothetical protein
MLLPVYVIKYGFFDLNLFSWILSNIFFLYSKLFLVFIVHQSITKNLAENFPSFFGTFFLLSMYVF